MHVHTSHLGVFLKCRFWLSRPGWGLSFCISDQLPGDAILGVARKAILISFFLLALTLNRMLPLITILWKFSHSWFGKQLGRWKLLDNSRKKALRIWKEGFLRVSGALSADTCWPCFCTCVTASSPKKSSLSWPNLFSDFAGFHEIPCHSHWMIPLWGPTHFVLLSWETQLYAIWTKEK